MIDAMTVPGLPFTLSPSPEAAWKISEMPAVLTATATPHSDIFIDPGADTQLNAESLVNAATMLGVPPNGDFQFSARVTVEFASTYDAGVLLLWIDERRWGKLCFEFSPHREPMIVSVVTRGVSDDANAFTVDGSSVWLRISRIDHAFAYHASLDGRVWRMIRFFSLDDTSTTPRIGFEAQSPTGQGCIVAFDDIRFTSRRLGDLRDGS
jgi:regulation of enolase protein 1 (concanavalin A-like superfamily)